MNLPHSTHDTQANIYFDAEHYQLDRQMIAESSQYVGHVSMVPEMGDYRSLHWNDHREILINSPGTGPQIMSNVCRHRQGIMLEGQGNTKNIVCPLHRWTYDANGVLIGAPHFAEQPRCQLDHESTREYQGLLFRGTGDVVQRLSSLPVLKEYDFSGYRLRHSQVDNYDFDWKIFMEVYLDLYHVDPYHPGLSSLVDTGRISWQFGEDVSAQVLGYRAEPNNRNLPNLYDRYLEMVGGIVGQPRHGAIWVTMYPNVMIEIYPGAMVVSVVWPTGPGQCANLTEFYYPEDIFHFEPEFMAAHQAAYLETSWEDQNICESMSRGRLAVYENHLYRRGSPYLTGPVLGHLEEGYVDFYRYIAHTYDTLKQQ